MVNTISRKRLLGQFSVFWLTWLVVQYFINVPIQHHLGGWWQELALDAVKLAVWCGGAWWFLHRAPQSGLTVSPTDQWRPNWSFTAGYWVWGVITLYLLAQFYLAHHGLRIAHGFIPEYFGRYFLVVGVTEEFVFRGYFLNALLKHVSFVQANTLQAIAFASLHIPRYLTTIPAMSPMTWISNLVSVAILGAIFGWLYVKSRSLWPGIVVHMTWDILVTLFA